MENTAIDREATGIITQDKVTWYSDQDRIKMSDIIDFIHLSNIVVSFLLCGSFYVG